MVEHCKFGHLTTVCFACKHWYLYEATLSEIHNSDAIVFDSVITTTSAGFGLWWRLLPTKRLKDGKYRMLQSALGWTNVASLIIQQLWQ